MKIQDSIVRHEPYTIDLLNYEIMQAIGKGDLPTNRFSGRNVRANSAKLKKIKQR